MHYQKNTSIMSNSNCYLPFIIYTDIDKNELRFPSDKKHLYGIMIIDGLYFYVLVWNDVLHYCFTSSQFFIYYVIFHVFTSLTMNFDKFSSCCHTQIKSKQIKFLEAICIV